MSKDPQREAGETLSQGCLLTFGTTIAVANLRSSRQFAGFGRSEADTDPEHLSDRQVSRSLVTLPAMRHLASTVAL